MKKIIAAIDGLKYSESATKYAVDFAKICNAHLVGVFLDDFTYRSYTIPELVTEYGVSEEKMKRLDDNDRAVRIQSVERFEEACRKSRLNYSVHHDRKIALHELLHETIYADLLVIDKEETFAHYEETPPSRFMRELMVNAACPVLVVPKKYQAIEKIVLLYDGKPSSVHAVRTFSYLFETFNNMETEVLSVKLVYEGLHLPDNKLMKEFVKRHYPDASYQVLQGMPESEIVKYLKKQNKNVLVVLGAYSRGMVSRWFKASMADVLMKELKVPLFIAHSK
ncbi:MAG TPA: universal stress protein [Puia sp.]|nr:universal stress protein [Puia sp.]